MLGEVCAAISPPRPPSLREGGDLPKNAADLLEDGGGTLKDLVVGEAEHDNAALSEEGVAKSITSLTALVRRAVGLDGELNCHAEEVGEVGTDGKLTSEQKAVELAST